MTNLLRIYDGRPKSQSLAVDGENLYVLNNPPAGSTVSKVPKAGGIATVLAHESAVAVAVDDGALYWATLDGRIRRLSK